MNAKRDEQKQKLMKKRMQETFERKKRMFFMREIFFFFKPKKRKIFSENKNEIKQTRRSLCSQKVLGLNGREWKKKKKGRSFLENFAKENGEMSSPTCWRKNNYFSARHNRIVKNVKNWRPFFKFFSRNFFFKKSNNEESKHNEKTHKERTKQEEEEVKRKSKEN